MAKTIKKVKFKKAKKPTKQKRLNAITINKQYGPLPEQDRFPINHHFIKDKNFTATVESVIKEDIKASEQFLVITGFTSISYLVEIYDEFSAIKTKRFKIILGSEPIVTNKRQFIATNLNDEIKSYWMKEGISPLYCGGIISLIESIRDNRVEFYYLESCHAKLYIGKKHAMLGSSNLTKKGLKKQIEANFRTQRPFGNQNDISDYKNIQIIAENYSQAAVPYNDGIIELLNKLLKFVTWEEALASAIAELFEGRWLKKYNEISEKLNLLSLWPSQKLALFQALSILDNQGSILIADPTGSGKTKLVCSLQLALYLRKLLTASRFEIKKDIIICPTLIKKNWQEHIENLSFAITPEIVPNSLLSRTQNIKNLLGYKKHYNLLVLDEGHNYINSKSNRSLTFNKIDADNKILITATPINKRPQDLLRLIKLLDVDNLSDEEIEKFKAIHREFQKNRGILTDQQCATLRDFASRFTVRRSKKEFNQMVDREPEKYINSEGKRCRYPKQMSKIYSTGESRADCFIASKINKLTEKLTGLVFLKKILLPSENKAINYTDFNIEQRLLIAYLLSKYLIQFMLRSSKVALVEHIEGTEKAANFFGFTSSKQRKTGDFIGKLKKLINEGKLPAFDIEKAELPYFLQDFHVFKKQCQAEINIYKRIASLAKQISNNREIKKLDLINRLFKKHDLILAFDSTVSTLDYLNYLVGKSNSKYQFKSHIVTGCTDSKNKEKIKKMFELGSGEKMQLALCSNSLAEGVNLQQASAMVFLDMPTVLRIAEQRIGRIARLDSLHKKIYVYWPDDSNEFALKADSKLIKIKVIADKLIGTNINLPDQFFMKHDLEKISATIMLKEYKKFEENGAGWEDGIYDAFKPLKNLFEGDKAIINKKTYEYYRDNPGEIRCKTSSIRSNTPFGFFTIRYNNSENIRSSKWYYVDDKEILWEESKIYERLIEQFKNVQQARWDDESKQLMKKFLEKIYQNEMDLLPNKKRRALKIFKQILIAYKKQSKNDLVRFSAIDKLLEALNPAKHKDIMIDYEIFADYILDYAKPILTELKQSSKQLKTILDLYPYYIDNPILTNDLEKLFNKIPCIDSLEPRCIVGIIGVGNR